MAENSGFDLAKHHCPLHPRAQAFGDRDGGLIREGDEADRRRPSQIVISVRARSQRRFRSRGSPRRRARVAEVAAGSASRAALSSMSQKVTIEWANLGPSTRGEEEPLRVDARRGEMGVAVVAPLYNHSICVFILNNNRNGCHHCHPHMASRTLIRVMTFAFARVGARSIPGPHRGPGFVIAADQ
jgi:hypothetical protein